MIVVDAENQILGRLASEVAKLLKEGQEVCVVNAEKCIITGNKDNIFENYRRFLEIGSRYKGPFYPKSPERIVKRTVRGMLPKNRSGRKMLKNLKAHIGIPREFEKSFKIKFENSDLAKLKMKKFTTLLEVSKVLGYE